MRVATLSITTFSATVKECDTRHKDTQQNDIQQSINGGESAVNRGVDGSTYSG
jgi:hypothetical protein